MEWIKIEERSPKQYEVVWTHHIDDLYPVAAFSFFSVTEKRNVWLREIEGPEDRSAEGKHCELYRPPTHWKPIQPPKE